MIEVTADTILSVCPQAKRSVVDGFVEGLPAAAERFNITTKKRMAHFLAHMAVETQGFTKLKESLYYTTAKRIHQVWPSRFPTVASARPYVKNPKKLACNVYNGRMGNRDGTTDGWDFIGRSPTHLTGRRNYQLCGDAIGINLVDNPELAEDPKIGALIAGWYWNHADCNATADVDDDRGTTKKVNGGYNGLRQRIQRRRAFDVALSDEGLDATWLRRGDAGPHVENLQRELGRLDYYVKVDGVFGTDTERAVQRFQREHGLDDDGLVGRETMAMIKEAVPLSAQDGDREKSFADNLKNSTVAQTGAGGAAVGVGTVAKEVLESEPEGKGPDVSGVVDKVSEAGQKAREVSDAVDGFSTLWTFVHANLPIVLGAVAVALGVYIVLRNHTDILLGKKKS